MKLYKYMTILILNKEGKNLGEQNDKKEAKKFSIIIMLLLAVTVASSLFAEFKIRDAIRYDAGPGDIKMLKEAFTILVTNALVNFVSNVGVTFIVPEYKLMKIIKSFENDGYKIVCLIVYAIYTIYSMYNAIWPFIEYGNLVKDAVNRIFIINLN